MKPYLLPVLLQAIGILVIFAEIFIPSFGLLAVIALAVFSYSLYLVFTTISSTAGLVFAGLDLLLVPVCIVFGMKILAKSPLALRQELSRKQGVVSQAKELETYLHLKGVSITDLRPSGMAEINMKRLDVVTDGEYIEANIPVVVTGVTGNRIIVQKIET
ncbi:MAG: serine protease [Desulfobacula sp. RIFOXYA12_FULL_46_16]|nr:MAG: serine protease [Deltaproteobacteria bacterium RIFOXYC2_FULL_48_10]OGR20353.1 MAG: serine protease [Desulfobacula sp. RIFOXYA12_FULL_46_16]OGR34632.1 MAG: serine protease [Desulfobacula sp. RIFOXYB2_FULL_45_6]